MPSRLAITCLFTFLTMMALASTARAMPLVFQADEYPATITGQQEEESPFVLTVEGGISVECESVTVSDELGEPLIEFELEPLYSKCTAAGFAATVTSGGCTVVLDANVAHVSIACPSEGAITVVAGTCELQVGGQEEVGELEYTSGGSPSTVLVTLNLQEIHYTKTKDGFLCPFAGTGEGEDGTVTGQIRTEGFLEEEQIGVFISDPCAEEKADLEECELWEAPSATEGELEEEWEAGEEEWPEEEESEAEEEEQAGRDPILFVHGYKGDLSTFKTMVGWFKGDGWGDARLRNWKYKWWRSNEGIALSVSKEVDSLLAATKASKVDIVSHSMGSLSSRYYIKELGGDKKVDEWVSLAGPNHGSSWAPFCSLKYVSCVEMKPKSTFLEELNEGDETPGAVNYKTWRSPRDLAVVPSRSVELTGAANEVLKGIKHSEFHEKKSIYEEVRNFVKN